MTSPAIGGVKRDVACPNEESNSGEQDQTERNRCPVIEQLVSNYSIQ